MHLCVGMEIGVMGYRLGYVSYFGLPFGIQLAYVALYWHASWRDDELDQYISGAIWDSTLFFPTRLAYKGSKCIPK